MAYWKENIKIEVKLPYITQGCTIGHLTAELDITVSDIWFDGIDCESRVWKAYVSRGDYPLLVVGKATNTPEHGDRQTNFKICVYHTFDGMNPAEGHDRPNPYDSKPRMYPSRVLSYN